MTVNCTSHTRALVIIIFVQISPLAVPMAENFIGSILAYDALRCQIWYPLACFLVWSFLSSRCNYFSFIFSRYTQNKSLFEYKITHTHSIATMEQSMKDTNIDHYKYIKRDVQVGTYPISFMATFCYWDFDAMFQILLTSWE